MTTIPLAPPDAQPPGPSPDGRPRVVIIGGGFGGLYTAQRLAGVDARVTLIDRRNFHLFQPLLYQVATGGLSPANIAAPLRDILKSQRHTTVLLAEVRDIDLPARTVILTDGPPVPYDILVVATGSRHHYFGHPEWEHRAPGLKTIEDATDIRRRVLGAFEAAELATDPEEIRACLTFVIVGAGPTGVELAGAVAELARWTLKNNFRRIDPAEARVLIVEGGTRVLTAFPPALSEKAVKALAKLGASVRGDAVVTDVRPDGVTVKSKDGSTDIIRARTVLWAAGVQASPLAGRLAEHTGAGLSRSGQVEVGPDLTLPGRPEVFVLGDMALCKGPDGKPLPGVAPVAIQQGKYVARAIARRVKGEAGTAVPPFRYVDQGNLATIGRNAAVADFHWLWVSGYPAWLMWLFIHLVYLIHFENRVLVMAQWAWNYLTRNRSARLITSIDQSPAARPPAPAGPGR